MDPAGWAALLEKVPNRLAKAVCTEDALIIRINGQDTEWGKADLRAAVQAGPDAILAPKVTNAEDVRWLDEAIEFIAAHSSGHTEAILTENLDKSPWEPLSVAKGYGPEEDVITCAMVESPRLCFDDVSQEPQRLLTGIVDSIPSAARREASATDLATGQSVALKAAAGEPTTALVFKTVSDTYGKASFFRVFSGEVIDLEQYPMWRGAEPKK